MTTLPARRLLSRVPANAEKTTRIGNTDRNSPSVEEPCPLAEEDWWLATAEANRLGRVDLFGRLVDEAGDDVRVALLDALPFLLDLRWVGRVDPGAVVGDMLQVAPRLALQPLEFLQAEALHGCIGVLTGARSGEG